MRRGGILRKNLLVGLTAAFVFCAASCGGGGVASSGGSSSGTTTADFSLTAENNCGSFDQGATCGVLLKAVSSGGFTGAVTVTINSLPAGVTSNATTYSVTSNAQTAITLTASRSAVSGNLSVTATSGSLSHSYSYALTVVSNDFSIASSVSILSLQNGGQSRFTVSLSALNNFDVSQAVDFAISDLPTGLTISPSSFTLTAGRSQSVAITAAATAPTKTGSVTVTAVSGSLTHELSLPLTVSYRSRGEHPPGLLQYRRTDMLINSLIVSNDNELRSLGLYDADNKRFFVSGTQENRIDVFSSATEELVAQIQVPMPMVLNFSSDKSVIYVGTRIGDLYLINPSTLKVIERIPAQSIGPDGYRATEAKEISDGRLLLEGYDDAWDGSPESFALWDRSTNDLEICGSNREEVPGCANFSSLPAPPLLTVDKTRLISTAGFIRTLNLVTGEVKVNANDNNYVGKRSTLVSPDGASIILANTVGGFMEISVFDPDDLTLKYEFNYLGLPGIAYRFILSADGKILYAVPLKSGGSVLAIDWKNQKIIGWSPTFGILGSVQSVAPYAIDENGLIFGQLAYGVGFIDASDLRTVDFNTQNATIFDTSTPVGSVYGGQSVKVSTSATPSTLTNVYFGQNAGTNNTFSHDNAGYLTGVLTSVSPASGPGPVDFRVDSTGSVDLEPDGFSYGPWISQVVDNKVVASGGQIYLLGYGLGVDKYGSTTVPSDLSVSVCGVGATITSYLDETPGSGALLVSPIEYVGVTAPAESEGTSCDVTVANSYGSMTYANGVTYVKDATQYPLSGAQLTEGVYDAKRDVYYFADASSIRVFSIKHGWINTIPISGATRLYGVAISPDGKTIVASDRSTATPYIYVLNPDNPSSVKSYSVYPTGVSGAQYLPEAVAVDDDGDAYYFAYYNGGSAGGTLFKLQLSSGVNTKLDAATTIGQGFAVEKYARLRLSPDGKQLFVAVQYGLFKLNVDSGEITAVTGESFNPDSTLSYMMSEYDVSADQQWIASTFWTYDTNLNPFSAVKTDIWNTMPATFVHGSRLSADGRLYFRPHSAGIYVYDGRMGEQLYSIGLPFTVNANYDALASNGKDNVLLVITGDDGDGVAVVDLDGLDEPSLPFYAPQTRSAAMRSPSVNLKAVAKKAAGSTSSVSVVKYRTRDYNPTSHRFQ